MRGRSRRLNDDELFAFLAVLLVAGNETTRNAISGGMLALSQFPDQKKLMLDNLDDDDFMDTRRRRDHPLRLAGARLHPHRHRGPHLPRHRRSRKATASSCSTRRPTATSGSFDHPDELDLDRDPNPHLAFGIGPHFCLGANLARMEVKLVFQELLDPPARHPDRRRRADPPRRVVARAGAPAPAGHLHGRRLPRRPLTPTSGLT